MPDATTQFHAEPDIRPVSDAERQAELEQAKRLAALKKKGGFPIPESQTPWQEMQRGMVGELSEGMVLKPAVKYQKIAKTKGVPRDNH